MILSKYENSENKQKLKIPKKNKKKHSGFGRREGINTDP